MPKYEIDDKDVIPTITVSQSELVHLITERDLYKAHANSLVEEVLPRLDKNEAKLDETSEELKSAVVLLEKDSPLLQGLEEILGVFGNEKRAFVMSSKSREEDWEWYEDQIFNEARLYEALGKEDARTVLGIFRQFKEVADLVSIHVKEKEVREQIDD